MLSGLSFDLTLRLPQYVAQQAAERIWRREEEAVWKEIAQVAWSFVNDSYVPHPFPKTSLISKLTRGARLVDTPLPSASSTVPTSSPPPPSFSPALSSPSLSQLHL